MSQHIVTYTNLEYTIPLLFPKMCKSIMFIGTPKQYTFKPLILFVSGYTVLHLKDDELTHFKIFFALQGGMYLRTKEKILLK